MAVSKKIPAKPPESKKLEAVQGADANLAKLQEIVRILEASTLGEIKYEDETLKIRVSRQVAASPPAPVQISTMAPAVSSTPAVPALAAAAQTAVPQSPPADGKDIHVVESPFVGTFYSAPNPDVPAFVDVGKAVKKGQALCIIEAMKLMNEIESDVSGTVVEVLAENGNAVQYGDPLFKIRISL